MKLIKYKDEQGMEYPGGLAKDAVGRVVIGKADGKTSFCMRVFEISPGGYSAKHTHNYEHQVFVHAGQGQVWNGEQWRDISSGSVIFIPANEDHQLKNNGSDPLVFVCVIPAGVPEL